MADLLDPELFQFKWRVDKFFVYFILAAYTDDFGRALVLRIIYFLCKSVEEQIDEGIHIRA